MIKNICVQEAKLIELRQGIENPQLHVDIPKHLSQ